jgi:hypothetical protein
VALDFEKLLDSPHVLDILLQIEDVLDSLDTYVFPNWFLGEVVDGPIVRRHWVAISLHYPIDKKPDVRCARRLVRYGIKVKYSKVRVGDLPKLTDSNPVKKEKSDDKDTNWEIYIQVPRVLISDMNSAELDFYDEDIDVEDVKDAQDGGITDESSYVDDGGDENAF